MLNEIYPNMSNTDYHGDYGVSRSQLMTFKRSPLHFWYENISGTYIKPESSSSMNFGSALHCYLLENDKFDDQFICNTNSISIPKLPLLREVGRLVYDSMKAKIEELKAVKHIQEYEFNMQCQGKTVITKEELDKIKDIKTTLLSRNYENNLLIGGKNEHSIFWQDKESGLICKCRPDIWHESMVVDLKTTADASFKSCQSSIYRYGYHIQSAMILDGIYAATGKLLETFVFLFVEKEAPYATGIYIMDDQTIEQGRIEYKKYLLRLKECYDKDEWPSYERSIINLPRFAAFEE